MHRRDTRIARGLVWARTCGRRGRSCAIVCACEREGVPPARTPRSGPPKRLVTWSIHYIRTIASSNRHAPSLWDLWRARSGYTRAPCSSACFQRSIISRASFHRSAPLLLPRFANPNRRNAIASGEDLQGSPRWYLRVFRHTCPLITMFPEWTRQSFPSCDCNIGDI